MTTTRYPQVQTYVLVSSLTNDKIRKATKVIFEDGYEVKFTERIPKRKAIREARNVRDSRGHRDYRIASLKG